MEGREAPLQTRKTSKRLIMVIFISPGGYKYNEEKYMNYKCFSQLRSIATAVLGNGPKPNGSRQSALLLLQNYG